MGKYFLDVPTRRGLVAAGLAIVFFVALAYVLYVVVGEKPSKDFAVQVANLLLQGALVSLLFAILKAIIDER